MEWSRDGVDWPNRETSRFVETRAHRWHVQRAGQGPGILLIHGAGAATHSWRGVLPRLAERAEVLAMDLPGHGFTRAHVRGRSGLDQMAADITALLEAEAFRPALIVGHSAGAAIGLRMRMDGFAVERILGLNPALMPFRGVAGLLFPALAKLLALNPLSAPVFSRTAAREGAVRNLIEGTGSHIDAEGLALYRRLIADRAHVEGALRMMSRWNLGPLRAALPRLDVHAVFAVGLRDRAVPPESVRDEAARMRDARVVPYPDYGHLIHEEAPAEMAALALSLLGGGEEGQIPRVGPE